MTLIMRGMKEKVATESILDCKDGWEVFIRNLSACLYNAGQAVKRSFFLKREWKILGPSAEIVVWFLPM